MSKTTRHIGYCPCCSKDFKVRGNKLVHHGFERPGCGYIIGDCMGALETPHELSPELAKRYRALIVAALKRTLQSVVRHSVVTEMTLTKRNYREKTNENYTITPSDSDWKWNFEYRTRQLRQEVQGLQDELGRITDLVDTWELKALTTREEDVATKRDAKAVREAAKVQKKHDKVLVKAAKYTKRIDSALKTKNSNTLAEIWQSCQRKLNDIDASLTKAECVTLLQRDNVWAAFGLAGMVMQSYWDAEGDTQDILKAMENRQDRLNGNHESYFGKDEWVIRSLNSMKLEWPADLGGENKKGTKTLAEVKVKLAEMS